MKAFVDLVVTETTTTIEGLMGKTPSVSHTQDDSVSLENLPTPYAISYIQASGDGHGEIVMVIPVEMGTALADMMLGGEGEVKSEMSDDDLDAIKEISSNILVLFLLRLILKMSYQNSTLRVAILNLLQKIWICLALIRHIFLILH